MGTGYATRNDSSNNIADGNVINAADIDGEFEAIVSAFGTGGHTHNGDAGEGGPITKLGPTQQFLSDGSSFYPSATSLDLGKTGNQWEDIFIDGKAYIDELGEDMLVDENGSSKILFRNTDIYIHSGADNELDIVADGEIHLTAPILNIDASTRVDIAGPLTLSTDGATINFGADPATPDIILTHVADTGLKLSSVTAGNLFHLESTEGGTAAGPTFLIERNSGSPANDDLGGQIVFRADDAGNAPRNIAKITTQLKDVTSGQADSEVVFSNIVNGTETAQITLGESGVTIANAITASSTLTINAGINVDNFNIDGTTIALSSGDMTLDGGEDIILDAAGEQVIFKDGSTNVGHVNMDSDNLTFKSLESDKDIIFKGNDGGSEVTALTLDMSEAGDASFGRNVTIGGNLTVSGTTTQIDSTVTTIADPIITLGANASDDNKDRGIEFKYNDGSARVGFFGYDDSEAKFTLLTQATNTSEVFAGTAGTLVANIEGNVSGATTVTGTTLIGKLKKTASDTEFTLPASDSGKSGQFLKTDGSGTLSFGAVTLTTINNNNDNRIITGSGTADTLEAESGLTYNGSTLDVSGAITASGNISTSSGTISGAEVTATSDERLKSDIKTIDNALDKVMSMRGVTYTMQAEKGTGVIAQEVEKILPEVVVNNEYKSVAYGNMVGVLIEAIKELKTEIDTHKQGCKCHE